MADDLKEVAERLDIPQSQIVREAVKEKVASLKEPAASEPAEVAA